MCAEGVGLGPEKKENFLWKKKNNFCGQACEGAQVARAGGVGGIEFSPLAFAFFAPGPSRSSETSSTSRFAALVSSTAIDMALGPPAFKGVGWQEGGRYNGRVGDFNFLILKKVKLQVAYFQYCKSPCACSKIIY